MPAPVNLRVCDCDAFNGYISNGLLHSARDIDEYLQLRTPQLGDRPWCWDLRSVYAEPQLVRQRIVVPFLCLIQFDERVVYKPGFSPYIW